MKFVAVHSGKRFGKSYELQRKAAEDAEINEARIRGQLAEQSDAAPPIDNDKRDPYAEAWGLEEDYPS